MKNNKIITSTFALLAACPAYSIDSPTSLYSNGVDTYYSSLASQELLPSIKSSYRQESIIGNVDNSISSHPLDPETSITNSLNKIPAVTEKLYSFINLPNNWDGYDGVAPSVEAIQKCDSLYLLYLSNVGSIEPVPMITGSGEVSLVWEKENVHIQAGFDEDLNFSFYADISGEHIFNDVDFDEKQLPDELQSILLTYL